MPESEEPVSAAAAAHGDGNTPSRHPPPPMPSAVSFQVEHTDTDQEAGSSRPWIHPHLYATGSSKVGNSEVPDGVSSASFLPPPPPPVSGQFTSPRYMGGDNFSSLFNSPPRGLSSSGMRSSQNQFQFESSPPMLPGIVSTGGYRYPYGLPMAGRPPWFYPSPAMDSGSGFDPRRQFGNRPSHLGFQPMSQTGRDTMGSPSGVTASSLQVNAPSSPTSVPSGGMQQSSENASNDNQEPGESTLPSAPGTATAAAVTGASGASVGGATAGGATAGGSGQLEKRAANVCLPKDVDVDSMSSLPLSIPDKSHEL